MDKLHGSPKFYVINMNKSTERLSYIDELFKKYDVSYERVEAVDGEISDMSSYCTIPHATGPGVGSDNSYYTNTVLAAMISHLRAMQAFVNDASNTDDYAVITEDDVAFDFCEYWDCSLNEYIKKAHDSWEVIQLVCSRTSIKLIEDYAHSYARGYGFSATAYLIKRNKAKEFVEKNLKDGILQNDIGIDHGKYIADYFIYTQSITFAYLPSLFTYRDNNDSYIHPSHLGIHEGLKNLNKTVWEKRKIDNESKEKYKEDTNKQSESRDSENT